MSGGPCRPSEPGVLACATAHPSGAGRLEESARRLSHAELAVALRLAGEGHAVRSVAEGRGRGPVADLTVCGMPVEVKSLVPMVERRGGRPATARTVYNRLIAAADQAGVVVLGTSGSGIGAPDVAAGVRAFFAGGRSGRVTAVRAIGDDFDLAWVAGPRRATRREAPTRSSPAAGAQPAPAGSRHRGRAEIGGNGHRPASGRALG